MGILPHELYAMELWEFNACARAFNERRRAEDRRAALAAYNGANWTAAALAGKLKVFSHYYSEGQDREDAGAQALTRAEMDEFDRKYGAKGGNSGVV
jgi:hypothetical protein